MVRAQCVEAPLTLLSVEPTAAKEGASGFNTVLNGEVVDNFELDSKVACSLLSASARPELADLNVVRSIVVRIDIRFALENLRIVG